MGRERCPECGQAFVSQTSQEIIWLAGKGSSQAEGNFDSLRLPAFKSLPTSLGINQAGQYVDNVLLLASSEFQKLLAKDPAIKRRGGHDKRQLTSMGCRNMQSAKDCVYMQPHA